MKRSTKSKASIRIKGLLSLIILVALLMFSPLLMTILLILSNIIKLQIYKNGFTTIDVKGLANFIPKLFANVNQMGHTFSTLRLTPDK